MLFRFSTLAKDHANLRTKTFSIRNSTNRTHITPSSAAVFKL